MPDKKGKIRSLKEGLKGHILGIANPVLAVVIAFVMGGLMVMVSGDSPIRAYSIILNGAFGSPQGIVNTVKFSIPMLLLAFSFSICRYCGYFNIGQDAQVYSAAIAIGIVSQFVQSLPVWLQMILMILAACITSAAVCLLPAIAKFKLGANEIVIGVMLGYLMISLLDHLLKYSFIGDQTKSTLMSKPVAGSIPMTFFVILVLIVVIAYMFILKKTVPGYRLQIIGKNPQFARASGLPSTKIIFTSAILGGILSGLAACGEIFGSYNVIYSQFAANFGFNGMIVALIGNGSPIGMLLGSTMLGALRSGSSSLTVATNVPSEIVECVQGFVIFFASVSLLRPSAKRKKMKRVEEV